MSNMTTTQATRDSEFAIKCTNLNFSYQNDRMEKVPVLFNINLSLKPGSRCLLLGPNGAGKTTLLSILAGKHLVENQSCLVLGMNSFSHTLGASGVAYLGNNWTRTVAFVGSQIPYQADIPVRDMVKHLQNEYPERRNKLMTLLEIDPEWRMHLVSDGQRRRIQIFLGLLQPYKVLLIDEMTVDLDVLARKTFLNFLQEESETNGVTILYATHIFDAMDGWATDIAHIDAGKCEKVIPTTEIGDKTLYQHAYDYLIACRERRQKADSNKTVDEKEEKRVEPFSMPRNGFTPGRMLSYYQ